ncbi:MAG TPA: glycosyltransferase family A protein [Terracidiphilus sp.]|nr:glycosyltransferase family A protein [Terracidiphilus sp.]
MKISVVIPTYNRRDLVQRMLSTLFAQRLPASEIIVVVDGSTDGTAEALGVLAAPVPLRVLEQPNRGPSAARNAGIHAAAGELILFLDDDMLCDPGLIAAHAAAHADADDLIALGSLTLSPDSPRTLAAACFEQEFAARNLTWTLESTDGWIDIPSIFSNTSLRREFLLRAGGFDEAFRMREDLELGYRLLAAGARAVAVPEAVARQHYDKSAATLVRDARIFAAGDRLFARKHPENHVRGQLNWFAAQSGPRLQLLRAAATAPALADLALVPLCGLAQALIALPFFRALGVRALQFRRRIHWLHAIQHLKD